MNYETTVTADRADNLSGSYDADLTGAPRSTRRVIIIVALVLAAIVALAFYMHSRSGEATPAADQSSQLPVVTVMEPGRSSVQGTINATGTLSARREIPVGVVGEGGRVVSVRVDQGSWVKKGQILAVIDRSVQTQQAAGAAAQIQVARADAKLAQDNLDRALQLVDRGFISKANVDQLTATRDAAVARVKVAEASYRELLARNARLNIVAPVSGLVLTRNVEPGQTVSPGAQPVFTMAENGQMELDAQLGEQDLTKVGVGTQVQVTPVGQDKTYTGQVWQVAPTIDAQTRQGTARVSLNYAPGLRPGGFATAVFQSGAVDAPMLPESAVMSDENGSYVYVVGKDDKVVRRPVKTGLVTDKGIAITSGLTGNERVVLRAGAFLNPGDQIKPVLHKPEAS
ncbi:MAG: efflux RND transporter periplasmic adaptor subunit [Sphingomonadaceae bacterium]